MTDMDLITELTPDAALPGADELAPARARLADAIALASSPASQARARQSGHMRSAPGPADSVRPLRPGRQPSARPLRSRRRLVMVTVAAGAVAAGVAAALVVVPGQSRPGGIAPVASDPTARAVPVQPFTGRLTAARFLNAAARAALSQPATPPRPDQFVYTETRETGATQPVQSWMSADGSQAGLTVSGSSATLFPSCPPAGSAQCLNIGYRPSLPTRPAAILPYLVRAGLASRADLPGEQGPKQIKNWAANDLGKEIGWLLGNTYLLPAQRAALFRYMAQTPGYVVVRDAKDEIGRQGVGIAWSYQGGEAMIIFSPRTYAYLGFSTKAPDGTNAGEALIKLEVVDSVPPALIARARTEAERVRRAAARGLAKPHGSKASPAPEESGAVG